MNKIKLEVVGLSSGQSSGSYTLILSETSGKRKLPIVIGSFEAQAIAIEIEKIVPFRPMTHDLFVNIFREFNIDLMEVLIYNLQEGVFHARLICEYMGQIKELDARTSDSIALAVRFKCPIYTYDYIMEEAGVILSDEMVNPEMEETPAPIAKSENDISSQSMEQLQQNLDQALSMEDYVLAAKIRDEMEQRNKS